MTHQIILLPPRYFDNEPLFAIFSSGTGRWIAANLTGEQVIDYYRKRAAENAATETSDRLAAILSGREAEVYAPFGMTFEEANSESVDSGGPDLLYCGRVVGTLEGQELYCTQPRSHSREMTCRVEVGSSG